MARTFEDPVLELAHVLGGGPEDVIDIADMTNQEAETALEVLSEVEHEMQAAEIAGNLRQAGLLW